MEPLPFKETENSSFGLAFWKAQTAWERGIRNILEPLGLTHTQFVLLASLRWLGSANQAKLSKYTGCDTMTVSSVVRSLANQGRIDRIDDPFDKRSKSLTISQKGIELIDLAVPQVEAFDKSFFETALGQNGPIFLNSLKALVSNGES